MDKKFKRLKSQAQHKKQVFQLDNDKLSNKVFLNTNLTKDSIIQNNHFNSQNTYHPIKLSRIKSQYIRPITPNTLPKTPNQSKIYLNKINVNINVKKQKINANKKQILKVEFNNYSGLKKQKNSSQTNKTPINMFKLYQFNGKKSLMTSKFSTKSLTREQSFINNQNLVSINLKQKKNFKKNKIQLQKKNTKKVSKKEFGPIKQKQKIKCASLNKISSTCSVKKYYILNKNKDQKKNPKHHVPLTSYRGGSTNPQQSPSCLEDRSSQANILKIYNSSTDLNNTTNSSEKERQILQRVHRTLQFYMMNLDLQTEKRRALQLQNQTLRKQLIKAMKITR